MRHNGSRGSRYYPKNWICAPLHYLTFCLFARHCRRHIFVRSDEPVTSIKRGANIWNLERAYWRYVEHNDLAAYSDLWHRDFLGWPSVSSTPVRKDHITDWITSQTAKGLAFKTVEFKPAAIQITGDVAFACYWVTFRWVDKEDSGAPLTFRITHAWLRSGKDWRIIGGMSMLESENPPK